VKYITNPWYDDHFDIPKELWLLGKTLATVTRDEQTVMGRSYMLIGWGLYEKFDKGLELIKQWAESDEKQVICQEAVRSIYIKRRVHKYMYIKRRGL
jgi:small subunit ribosomal protein S27